MHCPIYNLGWVTVVCVLVFGAQVQARTYATGDITTPCQTKPCAAPPANTSAGALSADCVAAASSDLANRWLLPEFSSTWKATSNSSLRWGPDLITYANVTASQVPLTCNPTAWAWSRMMRTINDTISLDMNYCHHHAPAYTTPTSVQVVCNPSEPGVDTTNCVCNAAGMNRSRPWQGVDCSNFVAFVLDFAFGFYPTSSIGEQACHPSYAPGRLLNVTASHLDQLLPGDLVYITLSKTGRTAPVRVSHVVMWTDKVADMSPTATGPFSAAALLANIPSTSQSSVQACMTDRTNKGLKVYVVADSSNNGPTFRPFCGWYITAFSHARRVIDPSPALPRNNASVAYWDDVAGNCMSYWALQS